MILTILTLLAAPAQAQLQCDLTSAQVATMKDNDLLDLTRRCVLSDEKGRDEIGVRVGSHCGINMFYSSGDIYLYLLEDGARKNSEQISLPQSSSVAIPKLRSKIASGQCDQPSTEVQESTIELPENVSNCDAYRAQQLDKTRAIAKTQAAYLVQQIEKSLADKSLKDADGSLTSQLSRAQEILSCAANKLDSVVLSCAGINYSKVASTVWKIGRKIKFYDGQFAMPDQVQAGSVLHEATHLCGTWDHDYFTSSNPPHDIGNKKWSATADTYGYWVQYGFCLPGTTCQQKK